MRLFDLIAVFVVLAAGFSYLNFRLLKLPMTIGLMALRRSSLSLFVLEAFYPAVTQQIRPVVGLFDFDQALLHGMLAFLLFAGALHINLDDLIWLRWPIAVLATVGVLLSTLIVGRSCGCLRLPGFPVAVHRLPAVRCIDLANRPGRRTQPAQAGGAPRTMEVQIAGESLFNDGVGVVLFMGLLEVASGEVAFDVGHLAFLFVREAAGGALFGIAIGFVAYRMLKSVDNYQVEILLSLALVWAGSRWPTHSTFGSSPWSWRGC